MTSAALLNDAREAVDRGDKEQLRDLVIFIVDMFDKAAVLIYAIRKRCATPIIWELLDAGCDPCLKYEGRTALYWAMMYNDMATLELLLSDVSWILEDSGQHGLDAVPVSTQFTTDVNRNSGCFSFCGLGVHPPKRTEREKLRAKVQRALNSTLFEAVCHVNVDCARRLLEAGANVNQFNYHDDEILSWCSPLIGACAAPITTSASVEATEEMVELLVRHGADISSQNCYGQSALHWACRASLCKALPLLLRNGADIDQCDKQGHTPLMGACDRGGPGCLSVCRCLLGWGADVSCRGTKDDFTALHLAVGNKNIEVVQLLLEAGVCPTTGTRFEPVSDKHTQYIPLFYDDSSTWQQLNPLDIAVNISHLELVKVLLRSYADINAPSHYNQTTGGGLIYLATESAEVTELLIQAGLSRKAFAEVARNRYLNEVIRRILIREKSQPAWSLAHQSRLCIRRIIARRYKRVNELPLPKALISYVNMQDLLD